MEQCNKAVRFNKYVLLCFLTILLLGKNANAQTDLSFNHINVENGLSKNSVLCITQDSLGYIWIGTTAGLNKFNGVDFKIYRNKKDDKPSFIPSYIIAFLYDKQGNLLIGTPSDLVIYNPLRDNFQRLSISKTINCLFQDSNGTIWIGTPTGIYQGRFKNGVFNVSRPPVPDLWKGIIWTVFEDHNKNIWVGSATGLMKVTLANGAYKTTFFKHDEHDPNSLSDNTVTTITEDQHHRLWAGTRAGLNLFDEANNSFRRFTQSNVTKNCLVNNNIRKLLVDRKGNLWIGTQDGLSVLNVDTYQFSSYQHDPANPNSLSQNSIYDIFQDNNGSIWIATYFGGVNQVYSISTPFHIYKEEAKANSINSNIISAIVEDNKHNLWIGTEAEGVNYLDRKTGRFSSYRSMLNAPNSLSSNLVKTIFIGSDKTVWIGMARGGMDRFDNAQNSFIHYRHDPHNKWSINSDNVGVIFEDSERRLWVGTNNGLNLFDIQTNRFGNYDNDPKYYDLVNDIVTAIFEDHKKNLWVATDRGVSLLQDHSSKFELKLPNNGFGRINCIKEDRYYNIWVGTDAGLICYQPGTGQYKIFGEKDGLPGNAILGILQDNEGNLWLSSDGGLSKFNPITHVLKNYNSNDGLPANGFNSNSYFKDNSGQMFFGGYNGMVSFYPDDIKDNLLAPNVVFTDIRLFNKEVSVNDASGLLKRGLTVTNSITFSHSQNVFTVNFAALNFIKPAKNKYAYKLQGFEKEWNYVSIPAATYTNLSAGTYTLLVKGTNNDGLWSKGVKSLKIVVLPPLWETWWAYVIYLVVIAVTCYYIVRFFRIRAKLKTELYLEHRAFEQQQELHQMKLNFFTNVSHEIRTPLTLISGPIEELINITPANEMIHQSLKGVKKNTDRLKRLMNELLDFRKAEAGKLGLHVCENNIVLFLQDIYAAFKAMSSSKHINFTFVSTDDDIRVYFDREQLEKVFFNLLSNAFKFTSDGGAITLSIRKNVSNNTVEIEVLDNGEGISSENLDKIFQNFYHSNNGHANIEGTGIGLALSKSIVELHKGQILVESEVAVGDKRGFTGFNVILLLGKDHFDKQELSTAELNDFNLTAHAVLLNDFEDIAVSNPNTAVKGKKSTILIVEDNEEVRSFILKSLENDFKIQVSGNGLEGWETAVVSIPDLIISDVMMPLVDGLEFCQKIKSDQRTSHIPVILLTALSDQLHQISGLQVGADAYIAKPFSSQILKLNINNMLALVDASQKRNSRNLLLGEKNMATGSEDDKFLNRLAAIINKNLTNPELSLADLTSEIGMSKSALYRKFNALTSLSLAEFIKNQRLKKAATLMKEGNTSVLDISIEVGFNDIKYFSREFKKNYGVTPTEFLKNTPTT